MKLKLLYEKEQDQSNNGDLNNYTAEFFDYFKECIDTNNDAEIIELFDHVYKNDKTALKMPDAEKVSKLKNIWYVNNKTYEKLANFDSDALNSTVQDAITKIKEMPIMVHDAINNVHDAINDIIDFDFSEILNEYNQKQDKTRKRNRNDITVKYYAGTDIIDFVGKYNIVGLESNRQILTTLKQANNNEYLILNYLCLEVFKNNRKEFTDREIAYYLKHNDKTFTAEDQELKEVNAMLDHLQNIKAGDLGINTIDADGGIIKITNKTGRFITFSIVEFDHGTKTTYYKILDDKPLFLQYVETAEKVSKNIVEHPHNFIASKTNGVGNTHQNKNLSTYLMMQIDQLKNKSVIYIPYDAIYQQLAEDDARNYPRQRKKAVKMLDDFKTKYHNQNQDFEFDYEDMKKEKQYRLQRINRKISNLG